MELKPPLPTATLAHARQLRRTMTDAERALWSHLRSGQLQGFKFRRQYPIPPYIADFCCVSAKLIIEIDGAQHTEPCDATRTRWLASQGWRVMRFWNNDVLLSIDAVIQVICDATGSPYPHPNPSPGGRGA
ncbi:endonuclease domain-containing protein [Xanthomonas hawaiiensis]|uniref:endonuclease domain-containing protein n=2 Tax=Xanthomonas TaxID=338 RepID=UPI001ADA4BC0|nr:endonuclease domain-containing protein [Xanthomonas sp. A6251]MBO9875300.1 endonuclease domain-containing protein [Xanthomonas sp. D-93]WNH45493.1 endonuclease domain-containing protein [Xanthomonas sp. A6251]